jgi:5-methylcytosine-specific restriction endonuclease McrA
MPRSKSDISNTAVRIILEKIGIAYDLERGFEKYSKKKHFPEVRNFFNNTCCLCGVDGSTHKLEQDHLVPINKSRLGLHAWGNIVPVCKDCNSKKADADWKTYLNEVSKVDAVAREARLDFFIRNYRYEPDLTPIADAVEELYEESGEIIDKLIGLKFSRASRRMGFRTDPKE